MIGLLLVLAQLGSMQVPQGIPDQSGTVHFETTVVPDTVYVGQQVTYDAVTLVDDVARRRLRANPEYTPSEVAGVTIYDFPFDPAAIRDVRIGGAQFRRYVYRRAFFPLTPGAYTVPPATLKYSLPEGDGSLGPARAVSLQSFGNAFVALPLPAAGKPIGFNGAVGELRDTLWTDGSVPRVGDTFVLTVRLGGVGNLKLLPRPELQLDWADVVPGDERVNWDSAGSVVRGSKEFDWVVTPKLTGAASIPAVSYDYFNPTTRRYETTTTSPIPITVLAASRPLVDTTSVPRDTIGDTPFPTIMRFLRENALLIGIAATLLAVVLIVIMVRGGRSDTDEDGEE